jgi:glucose-6-phosphate dehydrogenase assembly protein OpcA
MHESSPQLAVGQLRRQVSLGSTAVYRVRACEAALITVEVVSAPGLKPGQRFRFSRSAVERMELVAE